MMAGLNGLGIDEFGVLDGGWISGMMKKWVGKVWWMANN